MTDKIGILLKLNIIGINTTHLLGKKRGEFVSNPEKALSFDNKEEALQVLHSLGTHASLVYLDKVPVKEIKMGDRSYHKLNVKW